MRKVLNNSVLILILVLLVGCNDSSNEETDSTDESEDGGVLTYAMSAQPPTLDAHLTTSTDAIAVAKDIYETLITQNEDQQAVPMLAESVEVSDDQLTYTFELREDVTFHNGKEMTSEDVVASMERWLSQSARAINLLEDVASFEADGDYTVHLELDEPYTDVLDIMAGRGQFPAIMPSEMIESAEGETEVEEYIGTGPLEFTEWRQDQYIVLDRFDDYAPVEGEPSGTSGRKTVHVDQVEYHIVTDSSTRMAGVQTGEYDIALNMPYDQYDELMEDPNLQTYASLDQGTINLNYNRKEGLMTNPELRAAINAGIDANSIMLASVGNEDLYELSPSYMSPDQVDWATDAGDEVYNQGDVEKAQEMLEEAGYDGEEIVLYSTRDYDHQYNAAVVLQEQLEQMGVNVELEIYDWPTLTEQREDPENWDLMIIGTGYVTTPSQLLVVNPDYTGWTDWDLVEEPVESIRRAPSQEEAIEAWSELQEYLWTEYVPYSLHGHYASIITTTEEIEDLTVFYDALPWNVKKVGN